jgi:S1-C subfamily serine protease
MLHTPNKKKHWVRLCLKQAIPINRLQGTSRDEFGRLVLGDIIRAANEQPVQSSADLYRQLDKSKVCAVVA